MLEGKFKLYDNLKDIFDPKNKNQEYENIFEIQFKHSGSWGLEEVSSILIGDLVM